MLCCREVSPHSTASLIRMECATFRAPSTSFHSLRREFAWYCRSAHQNAVSIIWKLNSSWNIWLWGNDAFEFETTKVVISWNRPGLSIQCSVPVVSVIVTKIIACVYGINTRSWLSIVGPTTRAGDAVLFVTCIGRWIFGVVGCVICVWSWWNVWLNCLWHHVWWRLFCHIPLRRGCLGSLPYAGWVWAVEGLSVEMIWITV